MKTFLTSSLAAITLYGLLAVPTHADSGILTRPRSNTRASGSVLQGKVINTDTIVDPTTRRAQGSRIKDVAKASRPDIQTFSARREVGYVAITAVLSSAANAASENVRYTIAQMVNGRWVTVPGGSGTVNVAPSGIRHVSCQLEPTNDVMRLKIDINGADSDKPYLYSTKLFTLKRRNVGFVVRYGTNGDWVLVSDNKNDLSNGFDASQLARTRLNPLGLETRIRKTKSSGIDTWLSSGSSIRTELFVRTATQLERTFADPNAAEQFRQTLISLVKDRRLTVNSVREQGL